MADKKYYFASDFHLGVDAGLSSAEREKKIIRWLNSIQDHAAHIYLVGDIFDFWFEYRSVVPKGFVRLLGKLAELTDNGVPVTIFTGNHDMWMFSYLPDEIGVQVHKAPAKIRLNGKTFLIGHGDGLGPGDKRYKMLKRIFSNPVCQWLFAHIPPAIGMAIAHRWSQSSRLASMDYVWHGAHGERLIQYANQHPELDKIDYFVFGHRHLPIDFTLKNGRSRYINLGEWLHQCSYAVFDGQDISLHFFENDRGAILP